MEVPKRVYLLLVLMLGTGWVITSSASQDEAIVPYNSASQVVVDGVINQREYSGLYDESNTGIRIHWEHDGENMYIGLVSPGTGWVSIGFGPSGQKMDKANVILGSVDDDSGEVTLSDHYVSGRSHTEDVQNNIIEGAGTQSTEETIIEFVFPLNSGDSSDHSYEVGGTYGFIVAYHASSDDFGSRHTKRFAPLSLQIQSPLETTAVVPELVFTKGYALILLFVFVTINATHARISKKFF